MGNFISVIPQNELSVLPENRDKFLRYAKELCRNGGMMCVKAVSLSDEKVWLLGEMENENVIDYQYNLLEQTCWEDAGINKEKYSIYSGKVGNSFFSSVVSALYTLQALCSGQPALIHDYSVFVKNEAIIIGWINYVLDEKYSLLFPDGWEAVELFYKDKDSPRISDRFWYWYLGGAAPSGTIVDALAVSNGSSFIDSEFEELSFLKNKKDFLEKYKTIRTLIIEFKKSCALDSNEQVAALLSMFAYFFKTENVDCEDYPESNNQYLREMRENLIELRIPATAIKMVAEIYEKDFWNLWNNVRDSAKCFRIMMPAIPVEPVSTLEFFNAGFNFAYEVSSDDLIFLWDEKSDFVFSKETFDWMLGIRKDIGALINGNEPILEKPLREIINLLKFFEKRFSDIFCFEEFFNETIDNSENRSIQAAWKIAERIGNEKEDIDGKEEHIFSRLLGPVDNTKQKLHRYFELLANKKLRKIMLGF